MKKALEDLIVPTDQPFWFTAKSHKQEATLRKSRAQLGTCYFIFPCFLVGPVA